MRFAPPKFDFGQLPSGDIHYRADNLDAVFTPLRFPHNVQIFDPSVRQQEAKLKVDSFCLAGSGDCHADRGHILRMNAVQNYLQRHLRRGGEFENTESLVGPEVLVGGNVPPKAASMAEPLRLGKICLSTPGLLGQLLLLSHPLGPATDFEYLLDLPRNGSPLVVQYLTIGEISTSGWGSNIFRCSGLPWAGNCLFKKISGRRIFAGAGADEMSSSLVMPAMRGG
jgi:hypothetical protein